METNQLHDNDLEAEVLGGVMFDAVTFEKLPALWDEAIFHKPTHKTIAWVIGALKSENKPIDKISVIARLKANNKLEEVGGAYYVSKLTDSALGAHNTINHFQLIYQMFILRKLVEIGHQLIISTTEYNADPFEIAGKYESKIANVLTGIASFDYSKIGDLNKKGIQKMKDIKNKVRLSGVFIGFNDLDNHIGGWQRGELIILAARPAMGKTALAIQFLLKPALMKGIPTAFFSLEMGEEPITSRVQSIISGFSATNIIRANVTFADIDSIELATSCLTNLPFYIDETAAISLFDFRNKARKFVKELGVQLIIIDYLQLMKANIKGGNREQEISAISRTLKEISKELNIPIVALSQLSREVEKRANKRPMLSDLRESGAIEQDADTIMFIHRPEYYGENTFEDNSDATDKAEIIIAKNRNGSVGTTIIGFEKNNVRFHDLNEKHNLEPNTEF